jgi:hypothetical protein
VYTWGYGSGVAIGHPIPSGEASTLLPLIPIIEGNQYSTSTAAKVFPEGGNDDNKIRDCRCFDTDLNVMLPRRVECTRALGLFVEDASLGPGHMVMVCTLRDDSVDNVASKHEHSSLGLSLRDGDDEEENDGNSEISDDTNNRRDASGSAQGLRASNDAADSSTKEQCGDFGTLAAFDSIEVSKSGKNRLSSGKWMTKMKQSRTVKRNSSTPPPPGTLDGDKKKSFIQLGKNFRP